MGLLKSLKAGMSRGMCQHLFPIFVPQAVNGLIGATCALADFGTKTLTPNANPYPIQA